MNNDKLRSLTPAAGPLVDCPTCGLPAEIVNRFMLAGAPAPVEHVKVVCIRRHSYTLPVDMLAVNPSPLGHASTSATTG